ncbi:uncharacterized protein LOC117581404 [Drosophila guanche]|uniref:Uncharacterized protein n=1 Tax=Drosophila guanche TaxID=7266 RepID=A0A3B0JD76_DROGU|nr:uncharacterized protein LOC117581404 [Drosophila guanche]SPP78553.1 Hypothetical predicted protein [Drosophila guanche]
MPSQSVINSCPAAFPKILSFLLAQPHQCCTVQEMFKHVLLGEQMLPQVITSFSILQKAVRSGLMLGISLEIFAVQNGILHMPQGGKRPVFPVRLLQKQTNKFSLEALRLRRRRRNRH